MAPIPAFTPARPSHVVLITGCSSGIGRATALHLAREGWMVYATARKVEGLADLRDAGCVTLPLDVNNAAAVTELLARIERDHGAVGVLVNNAGYAQYGAVESLTVDAVRRQFETNVFGLLTLTKAVLPGMRRQGWGKVVNLSSMGGRLTFPGGGVYHASKYAVEALSEALRFELRGFGVDVILIEPGLIHSGFGERFQAEARPGAATEADMDDGGPYAVYNREVVAASAASYSRGLLAPLGGQPEDVARVIGRAISARRPKARYPVTLSAHVMIRLRRWLPDRWWDAVMRTRFPEPR